MSRPAVAAAITAKLKEALALHQQGRLHQAERLYREVLGEAPAHPGALRMLGNALRQMGRREEALESFDRALAQKPDYVEVLNDRGNVLRELMRPQEALASYDRALAVTPAAAGVLNNRGTALRDLKRLAEALASYERALALEPDYAQALVNRGNALVDLRRPAEALASYDRALALEPDYAHALVNRANALIDLDRPQEALASCERALALEPNRAETLKTRGDCLLELLRLEDALASYDRALALKPDLADARPNASLCRLLAGDFERGWPEYESRLRIEDGGQPAREFRQPLWSGRESIVGKTILLHAEQGLGDTLHFCRYVKLVAERGARVVLAVQRPLKSLLAGLQGLARLVTEGEQLPAFDYHCPLLSLPLAFGTHLDTIPAEVPYVRCDPARIAEWHARLGPATRPRIGLAWAGGPAHRKDHRRSIALADMAALVSDRASFISLQKEVSPADRSILDSGKVRHFGEELHDFSDTAALVACLDLVVTVDTAVAHLAGAMGAKTWVLLPFSPDWRWLIGREDSPWYPTARLFRQPAPGDWQSVIERVSAQFDEEIT